MPEQRAPSTSYNPATAEVIAALERIVGADYVIHGDTERLTPFSHDEIADARYAHMPDCVVRPETTAQVAAIMQLANRERVPVTPRGAGSGLSGGAVPVFGGIVLLCDRMNRIVDYRPDDLMITVEPGLVTAEINKHVAGDGLWYAGYPMSVQACFIGGNVAENAGGATAIKYGVTGHYVVGLEVVTPTGDVMTLGGPRVKDVTGYNLIQLMIGSEGTLGVFTRITLRLIPRPQASADLLAAFGSTAEAIAAVPTIMRRSGVVPASIEYMDRASVQTTCDWLQCENPAPRAEAMLLITIDGAREEQVQQDFERVGELCLELGATDVLVMDNAATSERIWNIRRNLAEAIKAASPQQSLEDIVVPISRIPEMHAALERLGEQHGVAIPCYGHAGDGNLHATPLMPEQWVNEAHGKQRWHETLDALLAEIYTEAKRLGGTISGEHGIGHKRLQFMPLVVDAAQRRMMRAIKAALDPHAILNPGKLI